MSNSWTGCSRRLQRRRFTRPVPCLIRDAGRSDCVEILHAFNPLRLGSAGCRQGSAQQTEMVDQHLAINSRCGAVYNEVTAVMTVIAYKLVDAHGYIAPTAREFREAAGAGLALHPLKTYACCAHTSQASEARLFTTVDSQDDGFYERSGAHAQHRSAQPRPAAYGAARPCRGHHHQEGGSSLCCSKEGMHATGTL